MATAAGGGLRKPESPERDEAQAERSANPQRRESIL
jgi:hypothetical protein